MDFFVVLIVAAVQYFMHFHSNDYRYDWFGHYYSWMRNKIRYISEGHPLVAFLILVVPILLGVSLIFALVYALTSVVGYFILACALLWYCLDIRDLRRKPYADMTARHVLLANYQGVFGVLFWFLLAGPIGIALYASTKLLEAATKHSPEESQKALHLTCQRIQAILDWVPVRLLGLTFALVSNFMKGFKVWLQHAREGLKGSPQLVVTWGLLAVSSTSEKQVNEVNVQDIINLLTRSLIVWVIAIGILEIHSWLT